MFTIERTVNQNYNEEQTLLQLDCEKTAKQDFKAEMTALQMQSNLTVLKLNPSNAVSANVPSNEVCDVEMCDVEMSQAWDDIVRSTQNEVQSEFMETQSNPEVWYIKYKHQRAKARLSAKQYHRLKDKFTKTLLDCSRLQANNDQMEAKIRTVKSNLKSTLTIINM